MDKSDNDSYKYLILFSLPSIFASFLEPLASIVDSALVGQLNTLWLASLALAGTLFNSFTWIFNFFLHVPTQNLSVFSSQGRKDKVGEVLKVAISLAFIMGIIFSFLLYFGRFFLYELVGVTAETLPHVNDYFVVRVFAQAIVLAYLVALSSLRGLSKVHESFYLVFFSTLVNIILSYLFLYQFHMGIAGAAWGTVLANGIGLLMAMGIILKDGEIRSSFFSHLWPKELALEFGANSFNLFLRTLTLTSCFFVATRVASEMGVLSLAAHQVALNFWLLSSYIIDGIAITANIKSAQLWASADVKSLFRLTKRLITISAAVGMVFMAVYALGTQLLWPLFTNDEQVMSMLEQLWPWVVYSQVIASMAYLYDGVLFGTTDYKYLRTHILIGAVIFYLPCVYIAHKSQSLPGIWAGLTLLVVYRLTASFLRVRSYGES